MSKRGGRLKKALIWLEKGELKLKSRLQKRKGRKNLNRRSASKLLGILSKNRKKIKKLLGLLSLSKKSKIEDTGGKLLQNIKQNWLPRKK